MQGPEWMSEWMDGAEWEGESREEENRWLQGMLNKSSLFRRWFRHVLLKYGWERWNPYPPYLSGPEA